MSSFVLLVVALAASGATGARVSRGSAEGIANAQLDCEPYELPAGSRVKIFHVGGTPGMEGSTIEFTVGKHQHLLGSKTAVCGADGKYQLSGLPPISVGLCKLEDVDDDYLAYYQVKKGGEFSGDPLFDISLYKDEIDAFQPGAPQREHVLQGTSFELACTMEGAVMIGGDHIACTSAGKFDNDVLFKAKCAYAAKLKITAVDFGDLIPSAEVHYFKVKLFSNSNKKYDSEAKFKPKELGSDATAVLTKKSLEDTFVQVTVCAEKGVKEFTFSRCKVGAKTLGPDECPECNVGSLLREASPERQPDTPYDPERIVDRQFAPNFAFKPVTVSLPIDTRGGYFDAYYKGFPAITVSISFDYIDVD